MPILTKDRASILLLASDPIMRSVMNEVLVNDGYAVWPTGDLGQAVDNVRMAPPDLLVVRTYIQGLTGHDAAKYLRTKCPSMRVLIVGGLLDDDRLQNREVLQHFEVFPKSYPASELLQKIKDVLNSPVR